MNPQFTIQQQLPCECEITVEAIDLQKDDRSELSLPAIDKAVTLYTYRGSSWLVEAACGGDYMFSEEALNGVTYGKTTVGEFKKNYKSIKTPGNPYYSDSLGIGADNFFYNINLELVDENGETQYTDSAFNQIDYSSDGTTFVDNIFSDDSMDDLKINRISLYICSKYEWNGELQKSVTVNEKVKNLLPDTSVVIEPVKPDGKDITLDPVTAKSVTVEMSVDDQGQKCLQGVVNLSESEISGLTFSQFLEDYHCISIAAPGHFANSKGVDQDDLVYNIQLAFMNEDSSDGRWLDNSYTPLNDECRLYSTIYENRLEGAEDYKLTEVGIRVTPRMEELDDGTTQIANETLRNMNDGDSFIVEFVEDKRKDVPVTVSGSSVSLGVWDDVDGGWLDGVAASGWSELLTVPGIEYNVTDLKDFVNANKSISATLPYFSDSVGAGRDAFDYQLMFVFEDGSEIYCDPSVTLGDKLTQLTDDIDLSGYTNTIVKEAHFNISAKRESLSSGKMQTVSEKIRALKPGDSVVVEFVEDKRNEVQLESPTSPVRVNVWKADADSWLVGNDLSGWTSMFEIPGVKYGETTFEELKEAVKSLTVTLPYYSDTVGAGKEAFKYSFVFEFPNESWVFCQESSNVGEALTQRIDDIDVSEISNTVIKKVFLNISPVAEDISENHSQAVSEIIRGLGKCSFIYEPVKDTREDIVADITFDDVIQLEAQEDPDWFEGVIAFYQQESDELNGVTAEELLSKYRSITVKAPGFRGDSMGLNADGYGYEIGIKFVKDDSNEYFFVDIKSPLDKDCTLYTAMIDGNYNFDGYKVDGIQVKVWALTEEGENGKEISVSPLVRELEPGTKITLVCRSDAPVAAAKPGNAQVELSWTTSEHAQEFKVYSYADGKFTLVKTTTDTSCTITGLTNDTKYGFAVAARIFSTWGEPDSSAIVYATPVAPEVPKPVNVRATAGDGKVTLTWDKVSGADQYIIKNGGTTVLGKTTTNSFTHTGLTNGTTYTYTVFARVSGVWSGASAKVTAVPKA